MFYGRLSDVYLGVITLSVTLIFFNLMNGTAGDTYHVGKARLNGFVPRAMSHSVVRRSAMKMTASSAAAMPTRTRR